MLTLLLVPSAAVTWRCKGQAQAPRFGSYHLQRPAACRYIIRVQAADEAGGWASQDVAVIVRKAGDSSGRAACCRSTGLIIAQQLGRPIDPVTFRPLWLASSGAAVGWESGYLQGSEDMEAERLFDYAVLAPLETGES
jgi:hypothetical protein